MKTKVLIFAPHTDDAELVCGGTIAKLIEEGCDVSVASFSIAEDSLLQGFPKDSLKKGFYYAMKVLGVNKNNLFTFSFKVRNFPEFRHDILVEIVKLRDRIKPDIVFVPFPNDIHQVHQVIASEGLRVFKEISILDYE